MDVQSGLKTDSQSMKGTEDDSHDRDLSDHPG